MYDAVAKDIRRAFPSIHQAVEKLLSRFTDDALSQGVGKTVAVLQILNNLPVTVENVAALMQPEVAAPSPVADVKEAIERLLNDAFAPWAKRTDLCNSSARS